MSKLHQFHLNFLTISVHQCLNEPRALTRMRRICDHSSINAVEWLMSPDCNASISWVVARLLSWVVTRLLTFSNCDMKKICTLTHCSMHESWHDSSHESWHDSSYSLIHLSLSFFFITFDSSILCVLNIFASPSTNSIFLVICITSLNPKKEMSGMSKRQCCSICGSSKQYNQYLPKLKFVVCNKCFTHHKWWSRKGTVLHRKGNRIWSRDTTPSLKCGGCLFHKRIYFLAEDFSDADFSWKWTCMRLDKWNASNQNHGDEV